MPTIDRDYYLAGSRTLASGMKRSTKPFETRAERYERAEHNFPAYFLAELEEELPAGTEGIVVIQQGQYPFGCDIVLNPEPGHYCAKQAIDIGKILRQPYVFTSRTYWLKKGAKKLEKLMDDRLVLVGQCCHQAAERYAALKGGVTATALGTHFCAVGRQEYPYRIWKLQGAAVVSYLLISLLNGTIFEVGADNMPELKAAPDQFYVGSVHFTATGDDYSRE